MTTTDAIVRFFHHIDRRDWSRLREGLTDEVALDYTSVFGGQPERLTADALLDRWRGLLPGFDGTQHFLGPVVIDGDRATANVRGYHHLDGQTWLVAGWYELGLAGDRLNAITLHTTYEDGDRALTEKAAARAGAAA